MSISFKGRCIQDLNGQQVDEMCAQMLRQHQKVQIGRRNPTWHTHIFTMMLLEAAMSPTQTEK